jgi:hypothetical protein
MKNIKKWSVSVIGAMLCMAGLGFNINICAAHEDVLDVFIYAIDGPPKTNPAYPVWSTNMVQKLYNQMNLDDADVGHNLLTSQVTQPADLSNVSNLWFAVRITSKDPRVMFSLSMLKFAERSSDPANSLGNVYDLSTITGLIYSPHAIGVIWSTNGPRTSDTIVDYGNGSNLVNEIDFIGMQSTYYPYSTDGQLSSIDAYLHGFTNNFYLNGSCAVVSNGVTLAFGQKTLQIGGSLSIPILTMFGNPGLVWTGSIMETNQTIILYHTHLLRPISWSLVGTFNGSDVHYLTNDNIGFFRAVLE